MANSSVLTGAWRHPAGGIDVHDVAAARSELAWVPPLRDAAVVGRGIGPHPARLMDVAERPVVHPGRAQVLDRAWRVVGVPRPVANVGVEQADRERRVG